MTAGRSRGAGQRFWARYPAGTAGLLLVGVIVGGVVLGPLVWSASPDFQNLADALRAPSSSHPLGTDQLGRDLLGRVIHGGRMSLVIALASVAVGLVAGVALGTFAAIFGAVAEAVAMRLVDALLALPGIVLAVILTAIVGRDVRALIVALGIYSTPIFARVAFSAARQVMGQDFVQAAEALAASRGRILAQHVLPNILTPIVTIATLRTGTNLLIGAALSFFGLGVQPPAPEWGLMIAEGSPQSWSNPYLIVYPGMCLFLVSLGFNLLGDGLRDWLDPRSAVRV